ncbi:hypothetical protein NQ176_g6612 [Zarea fungicola]|uniref:Uncharacterized protein n=1 Tax=Zarea fungicola TaxID=93591 RepID=A0ACC1N2E6_9HYPO|nr:hypothetical protein NQ176_g6612 [Lecanicillium fungicola]
MSLSPESIIGLVTLVVNLPPFINIVWGWCKSAVQRALRPTNTDGQGTTSTDDLELGLNHGPHALNARPAAYYAVNLDTPNMRLSAIGSTSV